MSIFSFLTFGARPEVTVDTSNLDGPVLTASAPGPLSRTSSKESLASRTMAREKALRNRQVSRQASHTSAEDRAAESARRHRKKLAANPKPQAPVNPFKWCFNFVVNALFGTPTDDPEPTNLSPASSICSSPTHRNLVLDADRASSEVPTEINSDNGDDAISEVSTDVSDSNLADDPNASADVSTATMSASLFTENQFYSGEDNSVVTNCTVLLNREREAVARAVKYAQEVDRKRIARVQLFEHQKAKFGENAAIWMQFNRDAAEEQERRRLQRIEDMALDELDVKERRELLLQGQQVVCSVTEYHEKVVQADQGIPQFCYHLDTHRDSLDMRASRVGYTSSEHSRVAGSAKLGTPERNTTTYHSARDRTTIHRSMYSRYHPYATFARPARSTSGRYFNKYDRSASIVIARFKLYDVNWRWLATPVQRSVLTFSDVPWPLVAVPSSPQDITPERVAQFLILKYYGSRETTAMHYRWVARFELLYHWFPDHITNWILPRIAGDAERDTVRDAADRVQKALVMLTASE